MKKIALIITALLTLSTTAMADDTGTIGSFVETGTRTTNGVTTDFTTWIMTDGYFKGENWGNFALRYLSKKEQNQTNDNNGYTRIEFKPEYEKSFPKGNVGGRLIFAQANWDNDGGSNGFGVETWGSYKINPKLRVDSRVYYVKEFMTAQDPNNYGDGDIQLKSDILKGTVGIGAWYSPSIDDSDPTEIRGLLNYGKWFPNAKVYTYGFAEVQKITNVDESETKYTKVGAVVSHVFTNHIIVDAEVNRKETFDTENYDFAENFFRAGIKYTF